jgi:gamma-glutamyltranspeptidase/glutathione hydrolase
MWFDALSKENDDAAVKNNAKNAAKQKLPASLLSSTAAAVPSPGLPPIHFISRRSPIYCTKACVATSQPLATSIGLHILRELGGNAADASVGIAAALAVLEPCSTGLGGDMFALWYDANTQKVKSINGSGRCPANLTLDAVKNYHKSEVDFSMGINSITVPGAAQGWEDTITKFGSGKLTLLQLLEPAIKLAEEGFPVSTLTAMRWTQQMDCITKWYSPDEIDEGRVEMSIDGRGMAPKPGQLFHNPHMAKVLRSLGEYGAQEGFYNAFPGRSIVDTIRKHGGVMTMEDLTTHASTYPEPIRVSYRGVDVWECPPNGQGIAGLIALEGLNALEQNNAVTTSLLADDSWQPQLSAEMLHAQIEMMRLGFGDARSYVCDPCFVSSSSREDNGDTSTEWLLDRERISKRALELFDSQKAVIQGKPSPSSCTVSFQVVDELGNAMSFVNSNYMGFGTGLIPHGCGFTLQNRGAGFSLDPTHPNVLAPHKRPYHTIIPAMLTYSDTGELYASLSNMGGFMQPQGHLQLVVQLVKNGLDPQTAVDAPRFCIIDGTQNGKVYVETGFKEETVEKLAKLGHDMEADVTGHEREIFGRAQIITRDRETGVLCAGSDGRADGCALGY